MHDRIAELEAQLAERTRERDEARTEVAALKIGWDNVEALARQLADAEQESSDLASAGELLIQQRDKAEQERDAALAEVVRLSEDEDGDEK